MFISYPTSEKTVQEQLMFLSELALGITRPRESCLQASSNELGFNLFVFLFFG